MRSQQHTCLQSHCQCSRSAWDVNTCNEKGIWIKTSTNVSMYICVTPLVLMPTAAKEQLAFKWSKSHNCFSLLLQKWLLSQCLQTENRIRWDCNKQTLPMQCCNLISKNSTCRILRARAFYRVTILKAELNTHSETACTTQQHVWQFYLVLQQLHRRRMKHQLLFSVHLVEKRWFTAIYQMEQK